MPDFPMIPYTPANWFWSIDEINDPSRVFSSAAGRLISVNNPAYQAWLAAGGLTTRIDTRDNLADVLAAANVRPTDADLLDRYKGAHAGRVTVDILTKVVFAQDARLRALEGQPPRDAAAFKAYVKEVM